MTAIFKKGEKFKASNYRPVSLTSICCKIQEHVITSNVLKHLDEHNILTDCQHGFRARRSCETQLLTLAQELLAGLDKKHQHDLIILDFSKAFDPIFHAGFSMTHIFVRFDAHLDQMTQITITTASWWTQSCVRSTCF